MTRITLWGWYQYKPDLFDSAPFPEQGDKQIFIDTLMERCGMLYTYHQQPDYLKQNITNWFTRKQDSFTRLFTALSAEYNPIENYDRKEDWTDTPDVTRSRTGGHTNHIENSTHDDNENTVSAYNSNTYQPNSKVHGESGGQSDETFTYQNESEKESGTTTHTGRMHGNIGVTTNQQMIESEIKLRQYDIYENICDLFEKDFLVQVYT